MLKVVHEENETHENSAVCGGSLLDEIVRDGARQLLAVALQAEVAAYIRGPRRTRLTRRVGGWWCVTGSTSRGR
jgi:hypothetical protein